MSKHTPGPWSVYGVARQHVRTNGGDSEFRLYKISHQADAALIAAAPEMLEACRAFLEAWNDENKIRALDLAAAAIAKATGGVE